MTAQESIHAHFAAMVSGDGALAETVVAPEHVNARAADEPPACRRPGPPGFLATGAWLRSAVPDLSFEVLEVVVEGDSATAHVRMSGHQTGPFVVFEDGSAPQVFPPSGRHFSVEQSHLFTLDGSKTIKHTAVRDDLGMMRQWGYIPPSPASLASMVWWKVSGRSRKAVEAVIEVTDRAALGAEPSFGPHN